MKIKGAIIYVSDPETGSSSSYGDTDIAALFQWALNWAGIEFRIEAVMEDDDDSA